MEVQCPYCKSGLEVEASAGHLKCGECRHEFRVSQTLAVTCPGCRSVLEAPQGAHVVLCGQCRQRIELGPCPPRDPEVESSVLFPTDAPAEGAEAHEETSVIVAATREGSAEELPLMRAEFSENYEILESLGHGGMGAIYKARQKQPPRIVVLKVMLNGRFASPKYRMRFEREAQAVARLKHPGVVSVYEYGEVNGQPYFTMEYVEGCTIKEYVLRHDLDKRQTCELMLRTCKAIAYAHQRGVIHRDIKPSNILVDGEGNPRLLDFGLARIAGDYHDDQPQMTEAGEVIGTPSYMSPEQTLGRPEEIDIRSDVYSVGVLFYGLLTDTLPYRIDRKRPLESLRTIREFRPKRPSAINPKIDGDLDSIVMKCLEKERDLRYPSAVELAEDVKRYLRGRPVEARPSTTFYHFRKLLWHHRGFVLPSGGAVVALLAVTAFFVYRLAIAERSARDNLVHAQAAMAEASQRQAELKEFIVEFESVRRKVESLMAEERWEDAYRIASFAEQNMPAGAGLVGIAIEVRSAIAAAAADEVKTIRRLVDEMRFQDARERMTRLRLLAERLDLSALAGQTAELEQNFDESCWQSLLRPNRASVRALERFLLECPDSPHAGRARQILVKLLSGIRFTAWPFDQSEALLNQQVTAEALEIPVEYEMQLPGGPSVRFVLVPAGQFLMGSAGEGEGLNADQEPEHQVEIADPFYISATEVTREQYVAVMGREHLDGSGDAASEEAWQLPVALSWQEAQAFGVRLSARNGARLHVRMPTEAEWEYACRAGSPGAYDFGATASPGDLGRRAWYKPNADARPHPVGQKQGNAWGLYDMHGNMQEWCEDWYDARYYLSSPMRDPGGPEAGTYRVLRGGSWSDGPQELRSAYRRAARPDSSRPTYGLRLCFDVFTGSPERPMMVRAAQFLRP